MPHSESAWGAAATSPTSPNANNHRFLHLTELHSAARCPPQEPNPQTQYRRRQSQQSSLAKYAMQSSSHIHEMQRRTEEERNDSDRESSVDQLRNHLDRTLTHNHPQVASNGAGQATTSSHGFKPPPTHLQPTSAATNGRPDVIGSTLAKNDTPAPSAPSSPHLNGKKQLISDAFATLNMPAPGTKSASGSSTPRVRPTTLDIPGLTKSKVSPDGRIAQRDVGAKLVIVMVGLPARGKSYITKKLARYLNWLQHDTRIFNVGERRRVVAGGPHSAEKTAEQKTRGDRGLTITATSPTSGIEHLNLDSPTPVESAKSPKSAKYPQPRSVAQIMLNGDKIEPPATPQTTTNHDPSYFDAITDHERDSDLYKPDMGEPTSPILAKKQRAPSEVMEQDATFFDPGNQKASQIREQVARETLDELLDFILDGSGSVGILDATNSTMERRKMVMDCIRERAGPDLNVLFLESRCVDENLLEANMRLKLSGPDYKDTDPNIALADFKKRVQAYEKAYVPLGDYEEKHNMPYIQMIDVGRKLISHQIKGFLMAQANYYLLNFNLAPRQIWITRHGLSMDNISGKIGGDSDLAPEGHQYAKTLSRFIDEKRIEWDMRQTYNIEHSHFPPQPGDVTPPNPYYHPMSPTSSATSDAASTVSTDASEAPEYQPKNFCVWTSMLKRSIETAEYFNDEDYDTKQMRMLDELNAGIMEGLTYESIATNHPEEYARRKRDKLHYRYPGPGGEGYLDVINRLRPVIVELERMTDHVLLVTHRSVARVLLAYFRGLKREEVADLDVPVGMLYCLEPKPYGVDFKAYKWDKNTEWFYEQPDFELRAAPEGSV